MKIESDKDVLQLLLNTGVEAAGKIKGLQLVPFSGDAERRVWRVNHMTGDVVEFNLGDGPRKYAAATVEDVAKVVNRLKTRQGAAAGDSFVWVKDGKVSATVHEQVDRRERVWLALSKTSSFEILEDLASEAPERGNVQGSPGWFDQRGIVDLLRNQLAASYDPGDLVATLRQIKIQSESGGESALAVGKESISRRAVASVVGLEGRDLPERVKVTVPVYDDWFEPVREGQRGRRPRMAEVLCAFDVDVQRGVFRLKPLAGQVEQVLLDVDAEIANRLEELLQADAHAYVFLGEPGE